MVEGSGTAPAVYAASLKNLFGVSAPVANQMVPFANWVAALPFASRPRSAAYAMVDDPFADPPVQAAQTILERAGIPTVYSNASAPYKDTSPTALAADARQVAARNPQIVVIGSVDVPTVSAFINEFKKLRFNPHMLIATSGPDQGQAFLRAIGISDANGIMVPNGWYGALSNPLSHVMVQEYIARYGGTSSDINADVAEAYSAGQVLADAVQNVGLSQSKIIGFLHSGVLLDTVQGPAAWGRYVAKQPSGQNTKALSFVFQWQPGANFVQVLSSAGTPSKTIIVQKQVWTGG
jgi:branched-chain amino acid transport system substrate-binding protein